MTKESRSKLETIGLFTIGGAAAIGATALTWFGFSSAMVPSSERVQECASYLSPSQQTQFDTLPKACEPFAPLATQHFGPVDSSGVTKLTFTMPSTEVFAEGVPSVVHDLQRRSGIAAVGTVVILSLLVGEGLTAPKNTAANGQPEPEAI